MDLAGMQLLPRGPRTVTPEAHAAPVTKGAAPVDTDEVDATRHRQGLSADDGSTRQRSRYPESAPGGGGARPARRAFGQRPRQQDDRTLHGVADRRVELALGRPQAAARAEPVPSPGDKVRQGERHANATLARHAGL